ncbi:hypothetical protein Hypma_001115 [Hypsizygus marmoreus]|uniref:Uncharacterized protein n=1 Tax=Hypsizygus marmoreus TaxID=39966 RepID=A0A369JG00_HYPMA|nr:hypothetical protein Hypma_001115 [Hypsizygus marmoreus]
MAGRTAGVFVLVIIALCFWFSRRRRRMSLHLPSRFECAYTFKSNHLVLIRPQLFPGEDEPDRDLELGATRFVVTGIMSLAYGLELHDRNDRELSIYADGW